MVHADVEKTGHALDRPPASNGDEGTYLVWTPGMSRTKPSRVQGWELVGSTSSRPSSTLAPPSST